MLVGENRFDVFRCDRVSRCAGGGVCAIIDKKFRAVSVQIDNAGIDNVELLAIDVMIDGAKYRFILCYRPPEYDTEAYRILGSLLSCLNTLCSVGCTVVILGDFNLPYISWSNCLTTGVHENFHRPFLEFLCKRGFVQCVAEPTRGSNILDLVLSNDSLFINECLLLHH